MKSKLLTGLLAATMIATSGLSPAFAHEHRGGHGHYMSQSHDGGGHYRGGHHRGYYEPNGRFEAQQRHHGHDYGRDYHHDHDDGLVRGLVAGAIIGGIVAGSANNN